MELTSEGMEDKQNQQNLEENEGEENGDQGIQSGEKTQAQNQD